MFGIKKIVPKIHLNRIIMKYLICLKIHLAKVYNHIRKEIGIYFLFIILKITLFCY